MIENRSSNIMIRLLSITFFVFCFLFFVASPAQAQVNICDYFPPCADFKTPASLLNAFVPKIMVLAGVIFFILLIVSGFQIIMHAGSGDAKQMSKWKDTLKAAVIGFLIIISAYWIMQIIQNVTGVKIPGF